MGMSADAFIAWGVDFGSPKYEAEGFNFGEHDLDVYDMEKGFAELFGFTEEAPAPPPQGCSADERWQWFKAVREPYNARLDAAVPVDFQSYGYEFSGTALVLKRSLTEVEWGCEYVDPATLAVPTDAEVAAIAAVFARWGIDWPQDIRLLLMARYG